MSQTRSMSQTRGRSLSEAPRSRTFEPNYKKFGKYIYKETAGGGETEPQTRRTQTLGSQTRGSQTRRTQNRARRSRTRGSQTLRSQSRPPRTCHGIRHSFDDKLHHYSSTPADFKTTPGPEAPERLEEISWDTLYTKPGRKTPPSSRGFHHEGPSAGSSAKASLIRGLKQFEVPQETVCGTQDGEKLYNSIRRSSTKQALKMIARDETDVNWPHVSTGWTCLHLAAYANNEPVVRALCQDSHVDVNRPANVRETPLHVACKNGRIESVKALLDCPRCDPSRSNAYGKTAMDFALSRGRFKIVRLIKARLDKDHAEMLAKETARADAAQAKADELQKKAAALLKDSRVACCGINIPRKVPENVQELEDAFANALKLIGVLGNKLRAGNKNCPCNEKQTGLGSRPDIRRLQS